MPETGLFELPTRPTMRLETVAKKNPKITMMKAPKIPTGIAGKSQITATITRARIKRPFIGRSRFVRSSESIL